MIQRIPVSTCKKGDGRIRTYTIPRRSSTLTTQQGKPAGCCAGSAVLMGDSQSSFFTAALVLQTGLDKAPPRCSALEPHRRRGRDAGYIPVREAGAMSVMVQRPKGIPPRLICTKLPVLHNTLCTNGGGNILRCPMCNTLAYS